MKKIYFLLVLFNLISLNIYSQSSTCATASPFCAGGGLTFPNTTNVPSTGPFASCLGSIPNPAWFYMQIGVGGTLNFTISQVSNGGGGIDVDFAAWGPFSSPACDLTTDLIDANEVGCSYSTAATETFSITGAIPGQIYMVLLTNFANQAGQITLTQTNLGQPGAGTTNCDIVCPLAVTGGGTFCPGSSATLTATISGATSYAWTGPGGSGPFGNTQSISVNQPGTYTVVVNKPGCVANATASATYTISTPPNTGTPNNLTICLPSSVVNLTQNDLVIQNGDPGLLIDYHTTAASAIDGSAGGNVIFPATAYNAGPFPQTIYVSIEDAASCIYTTSFTVDQINCCEAITANTGSQTICTGSNPSAFTATTTATAANSIAFVYFTSQQTGANMYVGGTPMATVTPSGAGIATFDPPALGTPTSLPNTANTYYVYAILNPTPANPSCRDFEEIIVTVNNQPNAGTNGSVTICDSNTAPIDLNLLITGEDTGGVWSQSGTIGGTFDSTTGIFTPAAGNSTNTFFYTVSALAPCTDATSTATVTINAQPNAGTDATITLCDSPSTVVNLFSLITGEQPGGTWTTTATTGSFDPTTGLFTTAAGGNVNAVFTYSFGATAPCLPDSSTVAVNFTNAPVITAPTPYIVCDDNNDGISCQFDLHTKDNEIIGAQPLVVEYYETQTNANTGFPVNIITANPYCSLVLGANQTTTQTIWIRVYDAAAPGCYSITSLQLIVNPRPIPNASVSDYELCDYTAPAGDGVEVFNLHSKDLEIANGISLATHTINFYTTQPLAVAHVAGTEILTPNTYQNATPNLQQIWFNISNNATGCNSVGSFNLVVNPLPQVTPPPPMQGCSNGMTMTASFNLSANNNSITGGASNIVVTYHASQAEADLGTPDLPIPYVTGSTTVYVRVENIITGCFDTTTLQLIVTQGPVANTPSPLQVCDPDNNGIALFDLSLATAQIVGANPTPPGVAISYHETPTDAQTGAEPITGLYPNIEQWSQIIYVRVYYTATNCANYVQLKLQVNPTPEATDPAPYHECDNDYDGSTLFNLGSITPEVLGSLDPSTHTVTYHTSLLAAQNGTGAITATGNYLSTSTTLWIRIEIIATGCYDIVELQLVVDPLPLSTQPAYPAYSLCDSTAPTGFELFSLSSQVSTILMGQVGMNVTFYPTLGDAQANTNGIINTTAYQNIPPFVQTLGIRVTNIATGCYVISTMDIRVEPMPTLVSPVTPYTVCDPDQNGFHVFDLCTLTASLDPSGNYTVTYHYTQSDAQAGTGDLPCIYNNNVPFMQLVWVRAEDALTQCVTVMSVMLQVDPSPVMPSPVADLVVCDQDANNQDGITPVNLELQTPGLLSAQTTAASDYTVSYYTSQANANAGLGSNIVNTTSYTGTDAQVIWIRIENNATGCFSIGSFILQINTPLPLTNPTPLSVCDNDANPNNLFTTFNLTVKDNEITAGGAYQSITYYPSFADAQAGTSPITTPTAYLNTSPAVQTLGVMVMTAEGCKSYTTLDIRVLPIPTPATTPPALAAQCENALDSGQQTFDLTQNATFIANGDPNVTLHYFHSLSDATSVPPQNEIIPATAALIGNPALLAGPVRPVGLVQNIYVVVSSNTFTDFNGQDCYAIVEQPFTINPLPIAVAIGAQQICEADPTGVNDGFEVFDLTSYIPDITAGNATSPVSSYNVTFYTDAALTSQIPNPSSYTNVTNPQIIYTQVTNTTTGCSSSSSFDILVNPKPELTSPGVIATCDDEFQDNDGYYLYPLDGLVPDILGSSQSATDYTVSFYTSLADADAGTNEITNTATYQAQTQTLWIRVENNLTGCYQTGSFDFIIEQYATPVVGTTNDMHTICVDYTDNVVVRDLTLFATNTTVYLNTQVVPQPEYTYQWYADGVLIADATAPGYTIDEPFTNPDATVVYTVVMTSTSTLGCPANSQSFPVTQSGAAEPLAGTVGYSVTAAFTDSQTITVTVQGWGTYQYSLDDGPRQDSPVFENVPLGSHLITVWDNEDGLNNSCDALYIQQIQTIGYPHYFTPNGDGIHDTWNIVGLEDQPNTKIYIFDRFGKLLKQISSTGEGWDGTYNGQPLPSTDYWFTVDFNEQNTERQFKAHFTLKR